MDTEKVVRLTGLTEAEREILDAYIRHDGNLTKAAKAIGISIQLASARKQRATAKFLKAREIIKEFERFRIRAPSILGV